MEPLFLGLRHVALNVRDVQKSLEFYSKVLGMKLEWKPDEDNAYLTSGQDNLALHALRPGAEPGEVPLVHHIGCAVRRRADVGDGAAERRGHGARTSQQPDNTG